MRILFITDNFPPEVNAPATRTYEHCKEWASNGVDVTVITGAPNYPQGKLYKGYKNKLYQSEVVDGIKVIRVWTYIAPNAGIIKRAFDFISFSMSSFIVGLFIKTDIIIATSPQLFSAVAGMLLSFFKRKPWIMEVRDLWPESIVTLGAMKSSYMIKVFEWLEKRLYRSAKKIVVVTDSFKVRIVEKRINPEKIFVHKNGANIEKFKAQPKNQGILDKLGLNGQKVVGYIGTHGLAHNLDFILKAISVNQKTDAKFLFIGDGAVKKEMVALSESLKLKNVIFHPPVSKDEIKEYLSIIDVSLVPLIRTDTFKTVIPSKIFEAAAMQKPILLGVEGESKELIERYNAGLSFIPDDANDFSEKLTSIIENQDKFKAGLDKLAKDFDRKKIAASMLQTIRLTLN